MPVYLPRAVEPLLSKVVAQFPAVVVTGPRQSGKTTLLRTLFAASHRFVSLDATDVVALARRDPRLFLDANPAPVVIDEIQHAPELLPYIKERIDAARDRRGQYLLTGSQSFALMAGVTESLAGRAAILELPTLSFGEQSGLGTTACVEAPALATPSVGAEPGSDLVPARLLRGGFPELAVQPALEHELWHESYVRTYLERDVRQLRQVGDLTDFVRVMVMLATRAGHLLNLSDLARDLGVAVNTVKAWVAVLEASHQIVLLRPYAANLGKRLVKTAKVYFLDNGTLCHLLGLQNEAAVLSGVLGGHLLENAVFGEIVRHYAARGRRAPLTFFRSSDGLEVDFLLDHGTHLQPIEVKLASTLRPEMADGLAKLRKLLGGRLGSGMVVTLGGTGVTPLTRDDVAVPFATFAGVGGPSNA